MTARLQPCGFSLELFDGCLLIYIVNSLLLNIDTDTVGGGEWLVWPGRWWLRTERSLKYGVVKMIKCHFEFCFKHSSM